MDYTTILYPILTIGGLGAVFGIVLGMAAKRFKVEEDEMLVKIREALPGANCGGCGFVGCDAFAAASAAGSAKLNGCPVGANELAQKLSGIMGVEVEAQEPLTAFVKCGGSTDKSNFRYEYFVLNDCNAAMLLGGGGAKSCAYGCLGNGSCINACQFGAISIVDGIAKVDAEKCRACGMCAAACPKKLIELIPLSASVKVACNSRDNGKTVRESCQVGCIGCKLCEKACKYDAIHTKDFLSVVDYKKCTKCGECVKKCPTKCLEQV